MFPRWFLGAGTWCGYARIDRHARVHTNSANEQMIQSDTCMHTSFHVGILSYVDAETRARTIIDTIMDTEMFTCIYIYIYKNLYTYMYKNIMYIYVTVYMFVFIHRYVFVRT